MDFHFKLEKNLNCDGFYNVNWNIHGEKKTADTILYQTLMVKENHETYHRFHC